MLQHTTREYNAGYFIILILVSLVHPSVKENVFVTNQREKLSIKRKERNAWF